MKEKIVQKIFKKLLVDVTSKAKRRLMDHEKMKGLVDVN